jgi:hypothetical protein
MKQQAISWWVTTIVILGALLTLSGGLIAMLRPEMLIGSGQHMNEAAYVYAGYLISRGLALGLMLLVMLALQSRRALVTLMVLTVLNQLIDVVVDTATGRVFLLPILLIFAIAFLIAATQISGQPLWKSASWRDYTAKS